jgi:endonuclease YncB( thermonuclease family)
MANRYTLIRGIFPILGTEPDGDTIRFQPDNPSFVEQLGPEGQRPAWTRGGTQINVRFEAIDALETHFQGTRQQVALGDLAARHMLSAMGFDSFDTSGTKVTAAEPESVRGYVLANSLDSYGRMIAFVYAGETAGGDGSPFFLDAPTLGQSVNAQLLVAGMAYPAFYTTLPVDLKDHLAAQARVVREQALGLWPEDAPSVDESAEIADLTAAQALVMWPKLFRRLVSYFQGGNTGLAKFDAWLREDRYSRDDYLQLSNGELGNMHDLVEITGNAMRLRYRPEDLVVLPDTFVSPPQTPSPVPPAPPVTVPTAALRIIAALPNPAGEDVDHETVTLINTAAATVDLAGWQLRDRQLQAAGHAGMALAGTIGPGEALRVPLKAPVQLGNAGDDVVLIDPQGQVADQVSYSRDQTRSGITIVFYRSGP